ncbi:MAG: hypothetical protein HQL32_04715 [Planctomycetes bacterium]|nr:hypothetical protein [Planctomycetota bacterium]
MPTGQLNEHYLNSKLLRHNPMGNPSRRKVLVYTPPGYNKKENYPCLMFLPGFGGGPEKWHGKDFPAHRLLDLLILSGEIPPVILCTVDGMSRLGGSQYIDSALNGPYMSHIVKEIVPFLQNKYPIHSTINLCGHSSGGFGALSLGSLYPEIFPRVASFAGDMYFELTHKNMLSGFINDYRSGKLGQNLKEFLASEKFHYVLGLAAAYSPNLRKASWKMDFPIDWNNAEINDKVWQKWLALDPINWIQARKEKLKKLDLIYLSCGEQDQYALHLGADCFAARCKKNGISCVNESHEGNHSLLIQQLERGFKILLKS